MKEIENYNERIKNATQINVRGIRYIGLIIKRLVIVQGVAVLNINVPRQTCTDTAMGTGFGDGGRGRTGITGGRRVVRTGPELSSSSDCHN